MAGHSASKTRVNALYVPAIHALLIAVKGKKDVDARDRRGHDGRCNALQQRQLS